MAGTRTEGMICYLQLPASDVEQAAAFYGQVFGWRTRVRGDGTAAFDDPSGHVSGSWLPCVAAADPPGMVVHVLVRDVPATLEKVTAAGGRVVEQAHGEPPEVYARIADPAGNVLGVFAEGGW